MVYQIGSKRQNSEKNSVYKKISLQNFTLLNFFKILEEEKTAKNKLLFSILENNSTTN